MTCSCGCLECACQSSCSCLDNCNCMVCYGIRERLCHLCHHPCFPQYCTSEAANIQESCNCFFVKSKVINSVPAETESNNASENSNILNTGMHVENNETLPIISTDSLQGNIQAQDINDYQDTTIDSSNTLSIYDCQAGGNAQEEQMFLPVISLDTHLGTSQIELHDQNEVLSGGHSSRSDLPLFSCEPDCRHGAYSPFQSNSSPNRCSPETSSSASYEPESTICYSDYASESPPSSEQDDENGTDSQRNAVSGTHDNFSFNDRFQVMPRPSLVAPFHSRPTASYDPTYIVPSTRGGIIPMAQEFVAPPPRSTITPPFYTPSTLVPQIVLPPPQRFGASSNWGIVPDPRISSCARFNANSPLRASRAQPPEKPLFSVGSNIVDWIKTVDPGSTSADFDNSQCAERGSSINDTDSSNTNDAYGDFLIASTNLYHAPSVGSEECKDTKRQKDIPSDSTSSSSTGRICESRRTVAEEENVISSQNQMRVVSDKEDDGNSNPRDTKADSSNAPNVPSEDETNDLSEGYAADESSDEKNTNG